MSAWARLLSRPRSPAVPGCIHRITPAAACCSADSVIPHLQHPGKSSNNNNNSSSSSSSRQPRRAWQTPGPVPTASTANPATHSAPRCRICKPASAAAVATMQPTTLRLQRHRKQQQQQQPRLRKATCLLAAPSPHRHTILPPVTVSTSSSSSLISLWIGKTDPRRPPPPPAPRRSPHSSIFSLAPPAPQLHSIAMQARLSGQIRCFSPTSRRIPLHLRDWQHRPKPQPQPQPQPRRRQPGSLPMSSPSRVGIVPRN